MIVTTDILIKVTEKGEDGSFCFAGNTLFLYLSGDHTSILLLYFRYIYFTL